MIENDVFPIDVAKILKSAGVISGLGEASRNEIRQRLRCGANDRNPPNSGLHRRRAGWPLRGQNRKQPISNMSSSAERRNRTPDESLGSGRARTTWDVQLTSSIIGQLRKGAR